MREEIGNLWDKYDSGYPICITTNGTIKRNGRCVMGRGIAREAKDRFPGIDLMIGNCIQQRGNHVYHLQPYSLFTFPVKDNWFESARLGLIVQSFVELKSKVLELGFETVYLPRPGCGNGNLQWGMVHQFIEPFTDDRFIFMTPR